MASHAVAARGGAARPCARRRQALARAQQRRGAARALAHVEAHGRGRGTGNRLGKRALAGLQRRPCDRARIGVLARAANAKPLTEGQEDEEEFLAFLEELRDCWPDLQMFAMRDFWRAQLEYWRDPDRADAKARAAQLRARRVADAARARLERRSLHRDEVELDLLQLEPYLDFIPGEGEREELEEGDLPFGATQTDEERADAELNGYALEDREYEAAMQAALSEALLGADGSESIDESDTALLTADTPLERKKRALASFSKSPKALAFLKESTERLERARGGAGASGAGVGAQAELELALDPETGEPAFDWGVPIFSSERIEELIGSGLGQEDRHTTEHDAQWNFDFVFRVDPLLRHYQNGWGIFSSRRLVRRQLRHIRDALPDLNPVEIVLNDPFAMTFEPEHDPRQCLPKAQVPLLKDLLEGADVEAMVYRHGCLLAAYVEEVSAHFDEVKELLPHEEAIKLVEAVPELLTVGFNVEDRQHNLDCLRAALKAGADIGLHPARVCDMVRHNPNIMLAADAPAISAAIVRWVDMLAESPAPGNGVWYTYGVMPIVAFNDPQLVQRYAFLHECHAEQEHLTFARVMEPDDEQFTELFPDYASWCNSNGVGPGHVEWGPGTHPFEGDVVTFVDEDVYESLDERDEMTVVEYGEDMEGLLDIPRGGLTAFSRNATTGVPWKPYE